MKQQELERLAVWVLQHLAALPDDTELSTYEAVGQVYEATKHEPNPEAIEFEEWFTLNELVWVKAGMYGLKLDDSKYNDLVVGLPHHIPFVVTHKNLPLEGKGDRRTAVDEVVWDATYS